MTTQSVEVTLQPGATMFEFKAKSRPERIQIYDFIGCICQNRDFQGTLCGIAAYQPTGTVLRLRLSNRRQIVLIEFPYYAIHQPFYEVIRHAMPWTAQCLMSDTEWLNDQLPIIRPLDVFDGPVTAMQIMNTQPGAMPLIRYTPHYARSQVQPAEEDSGVVGDGDSEVLGRPEFRV